MGSIFIGGGDLEFNKIWDTIIECWQFKILASFFVTAFTFLVGDIEAPFIALWLLVVVDTLTKWASVSKMTLDQQGGEGSIWYGFYLAWHTGALSSREMRHKFATKVFAYFVIIIASNLVAKVLPCIMLAGGDLSKMPGSLVISFLAITELMSIIENLIAMGMDVLKPLAVWACKKRNDLTGGN